MQEMCGPECGYGAEADPGGLKKGVWLEILTDCKAMSTWLSCVGQTDKAFTHGAWRNIPGIAHERHTFTTK